MNDVTITEITKPTVFDPAKPVQTRDGKEVQIIATDVRGSYPIVAVVKMPNHDSDPVIRVSKEGYFNNAYGNPFDLVNVPEQRVVDYWLNLYPDGSVAINESEDQARKYCSRSGVTVHIQKTFNV